MWKPVLSTVAVVSVLWGMAFQYQAESPQPLDLLTLNPQGTRPAVLLVYHPGLSPFPTRVSWEVAQGLAAQGLRVDVATASTRAPTDLAAYDAVVVVTPTYWWTPAVPVLDWVEAAGLQGKSVAAVVTASGQGQKSLERLTAALKDKGATVVGRLMVFRSAPNDEANYSAADNEAAGLRRARALGETLGSQLRSALAP